MSYHIYQKNEKTGITYVYEATGTWVPELGQSRLKKTCIGHLDEKTGEIVPNRPRRKKNAGLQEDAAKGADYETLYRELLAEHELLKKKYTDLSMEHGRVIREAEAFLRSIAGGNRE